MTVSMSYLEDGFETMEHSLDSVMDGLENVYWDLQGGKQTLKVSGVEAEFDATTTSGGDIIRWTYDIEQEWLQDLLTNLRPGDVLFDVGANLGFYACFAAKKLSGSGDVVAFEPYPPNQEQLRQNLAHNDGQTRVLDVALSDSEDTVKFTGSNGSRTGYATGTISPNGQNASTDHWISTRRGDELVKHGIVPQPSVVKIDVEGSEPLVLKGLKQTLQDDRCRLLFLEIHLPKEGRPSVRDYNSSREDILQRVRDYGFEIEQVDDRTGELHVRARQTSLE